MRPCFFSSSEIKLIIFDLDGTLINAYTAIARSFNYAMSRLKYKKQKASVIRKAVGWGDENLLKPFIKRSELHRALLIYRKHHKESLLRYSRLFPGVYEVLGHLRNKGYKLAIASNRPSRFSRILIKSLGLRKYFSYVLCADRLKKGKPHPEILNKIMERFKAKPFESVYIGDMHIDAQAGRRAKVKTIIVTTGSSSKREILKEAPYLVIRRITQLRDVL